jgi:predicted ATPase
VIFLREIRLRREYVPDFGVYPFDLPAVRSLESLRFSAPVTFFIGENGTGKSTILEAIAVKYGFNAEGGSRNFRFSTRPSHSNLHELLDLFRGAQKPGDGFFLRAESLFNVATEIERLDEDPFGARIGPAFGPRSLHEQSHGEAFLALFENRFRGGGLYMLDEPEAALSPIRQMALLRHMHDLVAAESQLIVATHSPILLAFPGATIYEFGEEGVRQTTYEETDHFRVTRDFLNRYPAMLRTLLDDSDS